LFCSSYQFLVHAFFVSAVAVAAAAAVAEAVRIQAVAHDHVRVAEAIDSVWYCNFCSLVQCVVFPGGLVWLGGFHWEFN
jgi:hypothetical protein